MQRNRHLLTVVAVLGALVVTGAAAAGSVAPPAPGERILFHRSSGSGVADIFSVRVDGTGLRRLTTTRNNFHPVPSPDGRRIVFSSDRGRGSGPLELYVMDADGRNVRRLTRGLLSARGWESSYDAAWSPDGTKLVFSRLTVTGRLDREELYVVNADGTGLRRLTDTPRATEQSPSWSPDGTTIAFERNGAVWTMQADGTGARRIAAAAGRPAFSPDGTRIAFSDARGRIGEIGVDGRGRRTIVRGSAPAWSPDGGRIVFQRAGGLYVVAASGSGLRRLTRPPALRNDQEPAWQVLAAG